MTNTSIFIVNIPPHQQTWNYLCFSYPGRNCNHGHSKGNPVNRFR